MNALISGADADELERVAHTLRAAADDLDLGANALTVQLRSVAWVGGVASRFGANWFGHHRPRVRSTADYVRDAARRLERNAAEQRAASRTAVTASPAEPLDAPTSPPVTPPGDPVARLEGFLDDLGLARDVAGLVVAGAEQLESLGYVHELLDVLTSDGVRQFLDGFDAVLDLRPVMIDLVTDFVEQPDLPFDERLIHAFADAALRFGVDTGMEVAAEWVAGAATTALLPGFGAVLAPVVGQVAGAVAGEIAEVAVDAIDERTEVVDVIADVVVDAYRDVKDEFGVLVDIGGAAIDLVGDAASVAGDVGGAMWDAGGGVVGALGDFLGG